MKMIPTTERASNLKQLKSRVGFSWYTLICFVHLVSAVLPADPTKNKGHLKDMVDNITHDNTYTSKRC